MRRRYIGSGNRSAIYDFRSNQTEGENAGERQYEQGEKVVNEGS